MRKLTILLLLSTISLNSYGQWFGKKTIKDNGDIVMKERNVETYNQVENIGSLDILLTQDEMGTIRIEASENIDEYILTTVKDNKLTIKLNPDYNYSLKHKVVVYVPVDKNLKNLIQAGSGDISMTKNLKVSNLTCKVSGSGDIIIDIDAELLDLYVSGSGDIESQGMSQEIIAKVVGSGDISAEKVKAEKVTAEVRGSGDISIYSTNILKARIIGSGDISVKGNPEIQDTKVTGSGNIEFE